MEVTKLLVSNGYVEDQAAYARFVMKPTEQDQYAWALSSITAVARVLCLVGKMKDVAAATVLSSGSQGSRIGLEEIVESTKYLSREAHTALLDTMSNILEVLDKDTFANVQSGSAMLATRLIEPIMRGSAPS
jgi:hypothetical protein